jgi:putative transposase
MSHKRWKVSNTSVYNLGYHLRWCPKYRRAVLVGDIEHRLKELLIGKAQGIGISIEQIEIMPDHVHLFIKASPVDAPHWIIQQLKGYTSRRLREEFSGLRSRLPTLWTRSYYCESVGHISEATVGQYIRDQKGK